jgi:hypothetical protein
VSSTPSTSCPGGGTAACTITITFKPTAIGNRSAEISLDSGGSATGQYIYVTGTALAPGPSFTTNVSIGLFLYSYLPVGNPGSTARQTFTVTNTGSTTLNLGASITGANATSFTADVSQCQSLAPQATCPVAVTYTGSIPGSFNSYGASLFLHDQSSSASATVSLSGNVSNQGPSVSTTLIPFPTQPLNTTSAPVNFSVSTNGDPVTLSLPANSGYILPSGSSCPGSAQPCTLSVAFSPQSSGDFNSSLTITDAVTGALTVVVLAGVATQ